MFDVKADYGEKRDVAAQHPDVVKELAAAFDSFWSAALPLMVNEQAVGPRINPFQELYYKQFGGSPTAEDLAKMDPTKNPVGAPKKGAKKNKKT